MACLPNPHYTQFVLSAIQVRASVRSGYAVTSLRVIPGAKVHRAGLLLLYWLIAITNRRFNKVSVPIQVPQPGTPLHYPTLVTYVSADSLYTYCREFPVAFVVHKCR